MNILKMLGVVAVASVLIIWAMLPDMSDFEPRTVAETKQVWAEAKKDMKAIDAFVEARDAGTLPISPAVVKERNVQAAAACQMHISATLNSPSQAVWKNHVVLWEKVQEKPGYAGFERFEFSVAWVLDAPNLYGVMLRKTMTCTMHLIGHGNKIENWHLISIE